MSSRSRVFALAVVVLAAACSRGGAARTRYPQQVVFDTGGSTVRLNVAVARTDRQKEHGLMGVRSLPADAGMAFVWASPTDGSFWMKDTLIPLSIAFVGASDRIVTIREMRPCARNPCPVYRSDAPYVVAIEANAGWYERHGVGVGDTAELSSASNETPT